jgi:signal transduction histidine kinase
MQSLVGRHAQATFGERVLESLSDGETLVVPDVNQLAAITPVELRRYLALGVQSFVAVPLIKNGEYVAGLGTFHATPRDWRPDEIALVEETAERTWAAAERARTETELRQLYGELEQRVADRTRALMEAEASQHALTRQLLTMQEAERRHLARELHDEVMQTLTALQINLDLFGQDQAVAPDTLSASTALVDDLVDQVRTLALDLRPTVLDELGLAAALEWYCQRQVPRLGLKAFYVGDPNLSRPHPAIETTCFRVVQEAVTNVARHARTDAVWVDLRGGDEMLHLTIRDRGAGFDVQATRPRAGQDVGVGLHGMEERLRLVGGRLEIRSAPGQGTAVHVWTPLRPPANGNGITSREEA